MIIIRSMNPQTLPRLVARSLHDRLRVMPAVVVTGARQTGKSTMVQELVPGGRRFLSLDDLDVVDTRRCWMSDVRAATGLASTVAGPVAAPAE
jgi:predicted AAA+ superfamily ATPase